MVMAFMAAVMMAPAVMVRILFWAEPVLQYLQGKSKANQHARQYQIVQGNQSAHSHGCAERKSEGCTVACV